MLMKSVSLQLLSLANECAQNKCSEFVTASVSVFPPAVYLFNYLCLYSIYLPICLPVYLFYYLSISLCVSVLPTIRVWQSEVNATADVGQAAMLTCAVDGYPEPMVTWTR